VPLVGILFLRLVRRGASGGERRRKSRADECSTMRVELSEQVCIIDL
jgi:hypothetical protein